jgi:hypothetical protein
MHTKDLPEKTAGKHIFNKDFLLIVPLHQKKISQIQDQRLSDRENDGNIRMHDGFCMENISQTNPIGENQWLIRGSY